MYNLYNDDCLEIMKNMEDHSIDFILCDLPYGTTHNKWDCVIDLNELWEQYNRIIKSNGCIALFSQSPFDKILACSNLDMYRYEWIWIKDNITGFLNSKKMPLKIHENILIFYKNLPVYNPQMRIGFKPYDTLTGITQSNNYGKLTRVITKSNGERYPIDVLSYERDKNKLHPTQKPVELLKYFIKTYTNENDMVLDNCAGSMSTGIACLQTNRNFICIEKDKNIFEIGKKRIEQEIVNMQIPS